MRTRLVPFTFLPLDGVSHTQADAFVLPRARHLPYQHHEPLPGCCFVPSDDTVEPRERDLDLAARDPRVHEPLRAEVLDRTERQLDLFHATISAAGPTMRA